MFNPKYRILLTNKCFPQDKAVCLGSQLILIVNSIKRFLPSHMWYGADVEAVGIGAKKYGLNDIKLNLIGDDFQFIQYCSEIEQFIWGEFLCMESSCSFQDIVRIELETEDPSFRSIDCEGVIIEIRTFDTTYFGIYSDQFSLMKSISEIYKVEIENC